MNDFLRLLGGVDTGFTFGVGLTIPSAVLPSTLKARSENDEKVLEAKFPGTLPQYGIGGKIEVGYGWDVPDTSIFLGMVAGGGVGGNYERFRQYEWHAGLRVDMRLTPYLNLGFDALYQGQHTSGVEEEFEESKLGGFAIVAGVEFFTGKHVSFRTGFGANIFFPEAELSPNLSIVVNVRFGSGDGVIVYDEGKQKEMEALARKGESLLSIADTITTNEWFSDYATRLVKIRTERIKKDKLLPVFEQLLAIDNVLSWISGERFNLSVDDEDWKSRTDTSEETELGSIVEYYNIFEDVVEHAADSGLTNDALVAKASRLRLTALRAIRKIYYKMFESYPDTALEAVKEVGGEIKNLLDSDPPNIEEASKLFAEYQIILAKYKKVVDSFGKAHAHFVDQVARLNVSGVMDKGLSYAHRNEVAYLNTGNHDLLQPEPKSEALPLFNGAPITDISIPALKEKLRGAREKTKESPVK